VVLIIDDNPYGLTVALRIYLRPMTMCWSQGFKMEKMKYNDEDGVEERRRPC
jgi:hypothetical protein